MEFLNVLKQAQIENEKVIIVLDKCELLEYEQIIIFSKLQEFIKSYKLCVILISQVSSAKFDKDIDYLPIEFEQYNSGNFNFNFEYYYFIWKYVIFYLAEISEILSIDKPNDWSMDVYKNFLTIFMGSFYGSCRDLLELKHLVVL